MASSNKTPHYQLSQFAPTDKPAWQGDYNADMKKIDNGIYAAQNKADSLDASVSEATNKATQALEKAEAAEDAAENAAALAQEAKTTADNISGDLSGKVNKAGDTMTGPLVLPGDPTEDNQAATKKYVDEHGGEPSGDYLPLSGGTLTGPITLAGDPSTAMEAATKQYADKMLPLTGGTMTGAITLPADPTSEMQAATKKYVDDAVSGSAGGGSSPTKLTCQNAEANLSTLDAVAYLFGNTLVLYAYIIPSERLTGKTGLFKVVLPTGLALNTPIENWSMMSGDVRNAQCEFSGVKDPSGECVYVYSTVSSWEASNSASVFNIITLNNSEEG